MEGSIITKLYNLITKQQTSLQALANKSKDFQEELQSGVNIKTINGNSILGKGNLEVVGGDGVSQSYVDSSISKLRTTLSASISANTDLITDVSNRVANTVSGVSKDYVDGSVGRLEGEIETNAQAIEDVSSRLVSGDGDGVSKAYVDGSVNSLKSYVDTDADRWPEWFNAYNTDTLQPEITSVASSISAIYDATNYEVSSRVTDITTYVANMYNTDVQITYTADTKTLNFNTTSIMPSFSYPVTIVGGSHVSCSNGSTSAVKGSSYNNTLTVNNNDYAIKSVTVYMAGVNRTSNYYASSEQKITIGAVTGTIVIVIEETSTTDEVQPTPSTYSVTYSGSNYTKSNSATVATQGSSYDVTISAATGYTLTKVTAAMEGSGTIMVSNGTVHTDNVTGKITITVVTTAITYSITWDSAYGTMYTSSDGKKTEISYGSTYTTTLSASSGYQLDGVSITMGGTEISGNTGVCVKQADGTYALSIKVSGNIAITVSASVVESAKYTITWSGDTEKCKILSTGATTISEGSSFNASVEKITGYSITSVVVKMGGTTLSSAYNASDGSISIDEVTGNIVITITAESDQYAVNWTMDEDQCTKSASATKASYENGYTATVSAKSGYQITNVIVKLGASESTAAVLSGVYNATTGVITITNPTNVIYITVTSIATTSGDSYNISWGYDSGMCEILGGATAISKTAESKELMAAIKPKDGYQLSDIKIEMPAGTDITSTAYTKGSRMIDIEEVTNDVVITITCTAIKTSDGAYTVTFNTSTSSTLVFDNYDTAISAGEYKNEMTANSANHYQIDPDIVKIEMGGEDITSEVCTLAGNMFSGTIDIPNVTGDIVITAYTTAMCLIIRSVSSGMPYTKESSNAIGDYIQQTATLVEVYKTDENHKIIGVSVIMGGDDTDQATYDKATGTLTVTNISGANISISVEIVEITDYVVTWYNISNYTLGNSTGYTTVAATNSLTTTVEVGEEYSNIISPASGYRCTGATVNMNGTDYTGMFNPMTGGLTIPSVTANATITVSTESNPATTYTIYLLGNNYTRAGETISIESTSSVYFSVVTNANYEIDSVAVAMGDEDITEWAAEKISDTEYDLAIGHPNHDVYVTVNATYTGTTYYINYPSGAYRIVSHNSTALASTIQEGDYTGYILSDNDGQGITNAVVTRYNSSGTTVNSTYTPVMSDVNGNGILTVPDISCNIYVNTSLTSYTSPSTTYTIKIEGDTDYLYYNQPDAVTNPLGIYLDGTATSKTGSNLYISLKPTDGHILKDVTVTMINGNNNCWRLFKDDDMNLFIIYLAGNTTIKVSID